MFQFKRNQMIVTVLVFMIAVAAYIGLDQPSMTTMPDVVDGAEYEDLAMADEIDPDEDFFDQFAVIDTLPPDMPDQAGMDEENSEEVAMSQAPSNHEVVISKKAEEQEVSSTSVVSQANVEVSYFVEEKMLREQSRASQIEKYNEYAVNDTLDADTRAKAAANLLVIQERIEKETGAESLLRAKGFKDVFVRMDDETVDVVVNTQKLSDEQIAQIEEIVHRKTGYKVGQIKIFCLKMDEEVDK